MTRRTVAWLLLAVVVLPLLLVACGRTVDHGTVVAKRFEPAHTWTAQEPTYVYVPVTRSSTSCSGKPTVCRTSTYVTTEMRLVGFHPVQRYAPDRWTLTLRDGDAEGTVEVSREEYASTHVGALWGTR